MIKDIKQTSDVTWEIPKTFKEGMRVPVKIFASKKLLENFDDAVFSQAANVATLPGIQKSSFVMPDGHSGYGFPIGGVAAMDINEGVISPGGIGFDINCLPGNAKILSKDGYFMPIKDFENNFDDKELVTFDLKKKNEEKSSPLLFIKKKNDKRVFKLVTELGHEIIATEDHPVFTKRGMVLLKDLKKTDFVAVYPFSGVEFEMPDDDVILDETDILSSPIVFNKKAIIAELKKRNLLPLRRNDPRLPALIKVLAFNTGDGSLVISSGKGFVWFWSKKEDLELIRQDIKKIGFTPSRVYSRKRSHKINTKYGEVRFSVVEYSMKVSSRSFLVLLSLLGAPIGKKVEQSFRVPAWIFNSPKWHKRLYLAAFFGAEMSAPSTMSGFDSSFYMPFVSLNKSKDALTKGKLFLYDLQKLLEEFGISSEVSEEKLEYINKFGVESFRIRLFIHSNSDNLLRFFRLINFEYNHEKRFLANGVIQYILLKNKLVAKRCAAQKIAVALYNEGKSVKDIVGSVCDDDVNARFILRSVYEGRKTSPRVKKGFIGFKDFLRRFSFGTSGAFWNKVSRIVSVDFDGFVYDFTVDHDSHNFVVDNFVVSNCGMRLLTTNLTFKDVKDKIKPLVDLLFKRIPAGVGRKGFVKVNKAQFSEVMVSGSKWCLDNGFAWDEDVKRTEESGCISGADPDKVSERAVKRGIDQIGTLGSGNHYLEVQLAKKENVFDERTAEAFGISEPDQVCVMIHTGSRGFGHQVASDYLKLFLDVMPKYGIKILDRELACAPFNSKEGQDYFSAMAAAANMAFVNRQVIMHRVRQVFSEVFSAPAEDLGMNLVYDVAHNIAKIEDHVVDGRFKKLIVHRKGATRAFGPSRMSHPVFSRTGQPVIVGGSMETGSFLLAGSDSSGVSFCSSAHGAGRTMSRAQAKKQVRGEFLQKHMLEKGIYVRSVSFSGLAEEAGFAYKDIREVVDVTDKAGISKKVVYLVPVGNVKG